MATTATKSRKTPVDRSVSVSAPSHQLTPQMEEGGRKAGRKAPESIDIDNDEELGTKAVSNVEKAKSFLEQKQLIPMGVDLTIRHLCQAIVLISGQDHVPSIVEQMLRSVVFILRDIGLEGEAEGLTNKLKEKFAEEVMTNVSEALDNKVTAMIEGVENQLKAGIEEIWKLREEIPATGPQPVEHEVAGVPSQGYNTQHSAPENQATYASIVRRGSRNPHATVIARSYQKHCQFWVDQDPIMNGKKTEKELVTEANDCVSFMPDELRQTGPKDVTFVSVKKLRNGGFLFELKSPEAVSWLRKPEIK